MPEVFVGAGSNADPVRALKTAAAELAQRFGAIRCSSVYCSAAIGTRAPEYLNMVIGLSTDRSVDHLRDELRHIEALAGRTRADPAVVALDLDLLLYGARMAALRSDAADYRANVGAARRWLEEMFDLSDVSVAGLQKDLQALEQLNIAPALPDISRSLQLLERVAPRPAGGS